MLLSINSLNALSYILLLIFNIGKRKCNGNKKKKTFVDYDC